MDRNQPFILPCQEGERAAICTCGASATMPLCDGSHKGTGQSPQVIVFEKSGNVAICGCGRTAGAPYCDGSHSRNG